MLRSDVFIKKVKKIISGTFAILIAGTVLANSALAVMAGETHADTVHPELDKDADCSLEITLKQGEDVIVSDASVYIKKVAGIGFEWDASGQGRYYFDPLLSDTELNKRIKAVKGSDLGTAGSADNLGVNHSLAADIEETLSDSDFIEAITNSDGVATFSGLETGLYLVSKRDETNYLMESFLISLPLVEENNGTYVYKYHRTANPKPQVTVPTPTPTTTPTPTPTTTPPPYVPYDPPVTPPTPPTPPSQQTVLGAVRDVVPPAPPAVLGAQRLPQTGQLWWPVPILAIAGCAMVVLGGIRRKNAAK